MKRPSRDRRAWRAGPLVHGYVVARHEWRQLRQLHPGPLLPWGGLALAVAGGALIGSVAVSFLFITEGLNSLWASTLPRSLGIGVWNPAVGLALLAAALVSGLLLRWLAPHKPQGPADLIEAAHHERLPSLRTGMASAGMSLFNISSGASVGIFGPLLHLGGCLQAWLARAMQQLTGPRAQTLPYPPRLAMGAGAAAAVAAVFSAPLGAAVFAYEAIVRRRPRQDLLLVLACAVAAFWASEAWIGEHRLFDLGERAPMTLAAWSTAALIGVASGLSAAAYGRLVARMPAWAEASGLALHWRPLVPALLLFAISPWLPHVLGAGTQTLQLAMAGDLTVALILVVVIVKLLATSLCLGFGLYGGVFGPALFLGALTGCMVDLLVVPSAQALPSYAVLGAASTVAAVVGAPWATILIMLELTASPSWTLMAGLSVLISTRISRRLCGRSLYDRQLLVRQARA